MGGVRPEKGDERATGEMAWARLGVDGEVGGGSSVTHRPPMAVCGAGMRRDGKRIGSRELRGAGWCEFGALGQWQKGAVRLGVEWLAAGPGLD